MDTAITIEDLLNLNLDRTSAQTLLSEIEVQIKIGQSRDVVWQALAKYLCDEHYPFRVHFFLFNALFPNWHNQPEFAPAWLPSTNIMASANITQFMSELNFANVAEFHRWTVNHFEEFWDRIIKKLDILFKTRYTQICDLSSGITKPKWLLGASFNIVDSCFNTSEQSTALIYPDANKKICTMSYQALHQLVNRIANGLCNLQFKAGDAIAIIMPMNQFAVAIYLAIIKMGGVVVSIADSFSAEEIALRLKSAKAKAIFTQDFILWGEKKFSLYEKVRQTKLVKSIVLSMDEKSSSIDDDDLTWESFLSDETTFNSTPCAPNHPCNILFSSGTTSTPKAIAWDHTTPIKVASDAYFHQNVQGNDVLAWPTNLGWMMGPWLLFAALINKATVAIYPQTPNDATFGKFIQDAKVTMLGLVPTLIATWRHTQCMENLDWRSIKVFSSSGECSNAEDMLYLMSLAGYKPIIEYCGGTEIGGSYVSSTVIQNNYPSLCSTPAMGIDFLVLDEKGRPSNEGEVALIPPSIGLSNELLNADHDKIYYENMPRSPDGKILRRHGDLIKRLKNGYYTILGRADDAMNLGGIKISAAEIERTLAGFPHILELAAIEVAPQKGPSQLIIYAVTKEKLNAEKLRKEMQQKLSLSLNPLFKIHEIKFVENLPKTASNKIMRRLLKKEYQENI